VRRGETRPLQAGPAQPTRRVRIAKAGATADLEGESAEDKYKALPLLLRSARGLRATQAASQSA